MGAHASEEIPGVQLHVTWLRLRIGGAPKRGRSFVSARKEHLADLLPCKAGPGETQSFWGAGSCRGDAHDESDRGSSLSGLYLGSLDCRLPSNAILAVASFALTLALEAQAELVEYCQGHGIQAGPKCGLFCAVT